LTEQIGFVYTRA